MSFSSGSTCFGSTRLGWTRAGSTTDTSPSDWNNADSKVLFNPPKGEAYSTDLWAPEIHSIDGRWYVIFTADPYEDSPPPEQTQFCTFDCPAVNHR